MLAFCLFDASFLAFCLFDAHRAESMIQGDTNPDVTWGREEDKKSITMITASSCRCRFKCERVEVKAVRNRSEAKGPLV